jgi:hypothetical protein
MSEPIAVLWRRLDAPGHDACQFMPGDNGWTIRGLAVFLEAQQVCQLRYEVVADSAFQTRAAAVAGWLGQTAVDLRIRADGNGEWTVNGLRQPELSGCLDLDLGFTPATNFLPVRRLALNMGEAAEAVAAYLAFPGLGLAVLQQRYQRVSSTAYEYDAPSAGYRGTLVFSAHGVIVSYPGLFVMEK